MSSDSGVRVTVMLADFGSTDGGKVNMLGGGWNLTTPNVPSQMSICGTIEVPWDEANHKHNLRITLVDGDGRPVRVTGTNGESDFLISADFEIGRPAGVPRGTAFNVPLAINFIRPPLQPGPYTFNVYLGQELVTHITFNVRSA